MTYAGLEQRLGRDSESKLNVNFLHEVSSVLKSLNDCYRFSQCPFLIVITTEVTCISIPVCSSLKAKQFPIKFNIFSQNKSMWRFTILQ